LKGGETVDKEKQNWRLSVQLSEEQERALVELRKRDEFCRLSYGELVRRLIDAGLEASRGDNS